MDPSGPNWLMTGSSRGHLTLWDMRFQLAVKSIQLAQVTPSIDTHTHTHTHTQSPPLSLITNVLAQAVDSTADKSQVMSSKPVPTPREQIAHAVAGMGS